MCALRRSIATFDAAIFGGCEHVSVLRLVLADFEVQDDLSRLKAMAGF